MATLPGRADCCWTATAPYTSYPPLSGSGGADVGVVGAGIVGLTAAYLLASTGLSVAVVEALRVGRQVTGRSTAKVTSQHSLIYRHLIETRGIDQAQRYAEANRSGARQICETGSSSSASVNTTALSWGSILNLASSSGWW